MLIERRKKLWGITVAWLSVLVILMVVLHVRMLTHQLMPVLRSPLFSIHISTIVTAYALLLGIAIVGIIAIIMRIAKPSNLERLERLKDISTAMLYPAVALLAMGIFIGAGPGDRSGYTVDAEPAITSTGQGHILMACIITYPYVSLDHDDILEVNFFIRCITLAELHIIDYGSRKQECFLRNK